MHVLLAAEVDCLNGLKHITLLEVSRTGARVQGTRLPPVGSDVIVRWRAVDAFGRVVWAADGRSGIQFDEPISVRDVLAFRTAAAASANSKHTPDELQAMSDWVNGTAR